MARISSRNRATSTLFSNSLFTVNYVFSKSVMTSNRFEFRIEERVLRSDLSLRDNSSISNSIPPRINLGGSSDSIISKPEVVQGKVFLPIKFYNLIVKLVSCKKFVDGDYCCLVVVLQN